MRASITTILSGGVERIPLRARIWIEIVSCPSRSTASAADRPRSKPEEAAA